MSLTRNISISALLLALFAIVGAGIVGMTYENTKERIAANERATVLKNLHALIKTAEYDNDIYQDAIHITAPDYLGSAMPLQVFRARKQGKPVASILTTIAPDGYNGNIKMLVGIYYDGTLAGVRVISHRETPGLGDAIDEKRSDWIFGFTGKSLRQPDSAGWHVKRDGGEFDQFTGATITPRAVVKAVHKALLYYSTHRDALFAPSAALEQENRT